MTLAPCPFCGGEAISGSYLGCDGCRREDPTHEVRCLACGAKMEGPVEEEVIAKWNGRVFISMSDQAKLARLENIALGSLIRKLEDTVRENEEIIKVAMKGDHDGEVDG